MITDDEWQRFFAIKEKLFNAIARHLEEDLHHKSYEGAFEIAIQFPNYFHTSDAFPNTPEFCVIRLDCYVIGPSRHYEWSGVTMTGALNRCEADIDQWIQEAQA